VNTSLRLLFQATALAGTLGAGTSTIYAETFVVSSTADDGPGSLRWAILDANAAPGADRIEFNIPGMGPHKISPQTILPAISEEVTVDGTTQAGSDCGQWPPSLRLEIDGSSLSGSEDLIRIWAQNVTVQGFVLNRAPRDALSISSAGDNARVVCNFIGSDVSGLQAENNGRFGVFVSAAENPAIGETDELVGNLISASTFEAVLLTFVSGGRVAGNYIGSDVTGNAALGNGLFGINVIGTSDVVIDGNVIVANGGFGVAIQGAGAVRNILLGNLIGIGADGQTRLGNVAVDIPGQGGGPGAGIILSDMSSNNTIGGTEAGDRNVISANSLDGIIINGGATGTLIQGNLIGTDASGLLPRGNEFSGIAIFSGAHTIGGSADGAGNVLSDNGVFGIGIDNADDNLVVGNLVGLGADGVTALGNRGTSIGGTGNGIFLKNVDGTQVLGNTVSSNANDGILLFEASTNNVVSGNRVGTDASGTLDRGNASDGIDAGSQSSDNIIGGVTLNAGNLVAFNLDKGIEIEGIRNEVRRNAIFQNVSLGLDLGADGVTANDPDDADIGANNLQNFPEIVSVTGDQQTQLTIVYSVPSSTTHSAYPLDIEFFLADADAEEGRTFIGSDLYETDDAGQQVQVVFSPDAPVGNGNLVVATATDADGNTSEFSQAVAAVNGADPETIFVDGFEVLLPTFFPTVP